MDPVSKDMDIVLALVKFLADNCGCDFTTDRVTDRLFLCYPSSPQSVTYQAQLHGTLQTPVTDLITLLQKWAISGVTIPVQLLFLKVESSCVSHNSSTLECDNTESIPLSTLAGIGVVIVMVIVFIVMTLIIINVVRRKAVLNGELMQNELE